MVTADQAVTDSGIDVEKIDLDRAGVIFSSGMCIFKWKKKSKTEKAKPNKKKKPGAMKPYKEIITKEAVTKEGLFTVHTVKDKNYFEIGDSILGKEILVVSRIAGFVKNLNF